MNRDQLSFLNPNYLHGCHPFDLRSYFENAPFFENSDSTFPFNLTKAEEPQATRWANHQKMSRKKQIG